MIQFVEPVTPRADKKAGGPASGVGLAVSGGGYRAMLFHLGAFLRLYEIGLLQRLDRISSVSGGSITAAKIALEWDKLKTREDYFEHVVTPIRGLASRTIDIPCAIAGILLPGSVARYIALAYRQFLFGGARLQDLPSTPEFSINATSVETGALWRFTKFYMGDWRAGYVRDPELPLSQAVAASSAFPPFLSPYVLKVGPDDFIKRKNADPTLQSKISLCDGGVYDNLGLERIWKAYRNVLVSDAGAELEKQPSPPADWGRHSKRVVDIIYGQVSSLRKRQLIASYKVPASHPDRRKGTYWGIRSKAKNYHAPELLPVAEARAEELAKIPTRLKGLSPDLQERLINWGYAICDTAIRRHFPQPDMPPPSFPYPIGV
jgi:NTE family protein